MVSHLDTKALSTHYYNQPKANELPLNEWLTFVLEELPHCTTDKERQSLLPHRFDVQRLKA